MNLAVAFLWHPSLLAPVQAVPLFWYAVPAGFSSSDEDSVEGRLNLNQLLIQSKFIIIFFFRVKGDSMVGACINTMATSLWWGAHCTDGCLAVLLRGSWPFDQINLKMGRGSYETRQRGHQAALENEPRQRQSGVHVALA